MVSLCSVPRDADTSNNRAAQKGNDQDKQTKIIKVKCIELFRPMPNDDTKIYKSVLILVANLSTGHLLLTTADHLHSHNPF